MIRKSLEEFLKFDQEELVTSTINSNMITKTSNTSANGVLQTTVNIVKPLASILDSVNNLCNK
jgi:hypothetical protein